MDDGWDVEDEPRDDRQRENPQDCTEDHILVGYFRIGCFCLFEDEKGQPGGKSDCKHYDEYDCHIDSLFSYVENI